MPTPPAQSKLLILSGVQSSTCSAYVEPLSTMYRYAYLLIYPTLVVLVANFSPTPPLTERVLNSADYVIPNIGETCAVA